MPAAKRVNYSDVQVFFDSTRILGVQSKDIQAERQFQEVNPLGKLSNLQKILTSNQTSNLTFSILVLENGFDPIETLDGLLNIDTIDIKIIDLTSETLATGCYLQSYSLNISVGEIPNFSVTYDADSISYNEQGALTYEDQTEDQNVQYFRPQEVKVYGDSNYTEGIKSCDQIEECSVCLQSVNISLDLNRTPVNRIGSFLPRMRYPTLPINGSIDFSAFKKDIKGIDLSSIVCEKGSLFFNLESKFGGGGKYYEIKDCTLTSVNESVEVGGDTTINFSYQFPLTKDSIEVT
jgi:hypothetical protein